MVQIFVSTTCTNLNRNIPTAQHSDVEHIDIIVQGNFRVILALQYEISENFHHTKITRYNNYIKKTDHFTRKGHYNVTTFHTKKEINLIHACRVGHK